LTPRYDWELIAEVVSLLPNVEFMFVGKVVDTAGVIDYRPGERTNWIPHLRDVLSMSNVSHADRSDHHEALPYYWQSGASWMPYDPTHPFVQASCPLKLMDGLACGRPVISADVPECRLYPQWIKLYENAERAAALLSESLDSPTGGKPQPRFFEQIEFARHHTWTSRARRLVEILEGIERRCGA
jgi:glycosyltransferase involved in cell wall biosynthesis